MRMRSAALFGWLAIAGGCIAIDPDAELCLVGAEDCGCTLGGGCDPGLACVNAVCVAVGPGSESGTTTNADTTGVADTTSVDDSATSIGSSEGTTGTPGDPTLCCIGSAMPGCAADPELEACVCQLDAFCCDTAWDGACAATAAGQCGLVCPPTSCCVPGLGTGCNDPAIEAEVCAVQPACCTDNWSQTCATEAIMSFGACAATNGCCEISPGQMPGCNDPAVLACTCLADPFCCAANYDEVCTISAHSCGGGCLEGMPSCCSAHPEPGCNIPFVKNCVCTEGGLPECCNTTWDAACVTAAIDVCGGCADCCTAHAQGGCSDEAVVQCVCDVDSTCCSLAWDTVCTDLALNACAAMC